MTIPHSQPKILCLLLAGLFLHNSAYADGNSSEQSVTLKEVKVTGKRATVLGSDKQKRQELDNNLVQDVYDMVRYDTGISVVEGGRAGSNGFSIRGVDKDRVAITVDGLPQAESRSSEAFQELFGAYGNFNTNRNAAELENISEVTILKGADSLKAGSGALGGAVMYQTKSAEDYVDEEKPYHIGLKSGYQSKSHSRFASMTLAGQYKNLDALFVYTKRQGYETKNHSNAQDVRLEHTQSGRTYVGVARGYPDPQNADSKSSLIKLGYHFTPNHYANMVYEDYRQDRDTTELSNLFSVFDTTRYRTDVSYRKRTGFEYRHRAESGPWDQLKFNWDKQKIRMTTLTWDIRNNYLASGRNAEADFKRRGLTQDINQAKIQADKNLEFENFSWKMAYGGGIQKGKYGSNNLEYSALIYYPEVMASRQGTETFLVGTKNRNHHIYWDNAFYFKDKVKLTLGARYDSYSMRTSEDDNVQARVVGQLKGKGLWGRQAKFAAPSYSAGLDWSPTSFLTLQSRYSTGFRAPTTDEMWFFFPQREFYVEPNPDLKAERAKNIELGIDVHGSWGNMKLSGFQSNYRNFIDFAYLGGRQYSYWNDATQSFTKDNNYIAPVYQNINRSTAVVKGIEFQGKWKLDGIGLPEGSFSTLRLSYLKGKTENDIPMNALQPFNAVWGLGYRAPDDKWSTTLNLSYFARKKPSDTIRSYEQTDQVFPFATHSKNYWLADFIGHYQVNKNFRISGGVFNIFNKKYYTWDSLRSIREFGAVNRVHNQTHAGIERFTSPGRNFGLMIEAKF